MKGKHETQTPHRVLLDQIHCIEGSRYGSRRGQCDDRRDGGCADRFGHCRRSDDHFEGFEQSQLSRSRVNRMVRTDRGEAVAQVVIAVPVVLLVLWLAVQATVFLHGANIAHAAASEGAAVAARYGSSTGAGERAVARALTGFDSSSRGSWTVRVQGKDVLATVSLRLPQVIPFFPKSVTRSAREPLEVFMSEDER